MPETIESPANRAGLFLWSICKLLICIKAAVAAQS
ncbi:hypothetical protein RR11_2371 [Ruegeria sp. R11]|nr:hypothetical protein RR11_2371 [Ruegeria sp. R11]